MSENRVLHPDIEEVLNFGPFFISIREEFPLGTSRQEVLQVMVSRGYVIPRCLQYILSEKKLQDWKIW